MYYIKKYGLDIAMYLGIILLIIATLICYILPTLEGCKYILSINTWSVLLVAVNYAESIDNIIITLICIFYVVFWLIFKRLHSNLAMNFIILIALMIMIGRLTDRIASLNLNRILSHVNNDGRNDELIKYIFQFILIHFKIELLCIVPFVATLVYMNNKVRFIEKQRKNIYDLIVTIYVAYLIICMLYSSVEYIISWGSIKAEIKYIMITFYIVQVISELLIFGGLFLVLYLNNKRSFWVPYLWVGVGFSTTQFVGAGLLDITNNQIYTNSIDINKIINEISCGASSLENYQIKLLFNYPLTWLILIIFVLIVFIRFRKIDSFSEL